MAPISTSLQGKLESETEKKNEKFIPNTAQIVPKNNKDNHVKKVLRLSALSFFFRGSNFQQAHQITLLHFEAYWASGSLPVG